MPHSTSPDRAVIALVAAHNRKASTLRAVSAFIAATEAIGLQPRIVLTDDGSTDGTAAEVAAMGGDAVEIITGDGTWFWARSMAAAERHALATAGERDLILWLNDDVDLDPDAIGRLVASSDAVPAGVVIGSTREPSTQATSYGGMRRSGRHPLAFGLVDPDPTTPTSVDTFNGNVVLVPVGVAQKLGGIDGAFAHAWADIDYGCRASRAQVPVVLAPGTFGECARNAVSGPTSRREEWARFVGVKGGGNPASTRRLLRRLAPVTWPFWWSGSYAAWWLRRLRPQRPERRER